VVEDEPAIRSLVSSVVLGPGFTVDGASDGVEALAAIRRRAPDVLLVGLGLPIMDGRDLIVTCRSDEATRRLPITVVSTMYGAYAAVALDVQGSLPSRSHSMPSWRCCAKPGPADRGCPTRTVARSSRAGP
jgi:CheY-like chemotaxis protein